MGQVLANPQIDQQEMLWALAGLCEWHGKPYSAELVSSSFPPPCAPDSLSAAAVSIGFRVDWRAVDVAALPSLPMPCIAATTQPVDASISSRGAPSGDARTIGSSLHLLLLVRASAETVTAYRFGLADPIEIVAAELEATLHGAALCAEPVEPRFEERTDTDAGGTFGFRWFLPELLRHRRIWRDVIAASLLLQFLAIVTPLLTQIVVDKVVVHRTYSTLAVVAAALGAALVFNAVLSWIRQYLVLHTGNRIDGVLASQVFGHMLRLPMRYFEQRSTGVLVARLHAVETIRDFISGAAVALILDVPFMLVFLGIMLAYSPSLTGVVLAIVAGVVALSLCVVPFMRERMNRQFLLGARNQAFLTEHVAAMETVKSLQMEPQVERRFGECLAEYLEAAFRVRQLGNTYSVAAHALEQLQSVSVLCLGAMLVMESDGFTIGMLVAFQMFAARLSGPILRMVGMWQQFQQADIAVRRLGDVMNAPAEPWVLAPARTSMGHGRIEVQDLGFRYGEDRPYLYRNLNFSIEPGTCVAVTGESGSGKSTLARLLLGFYRASEGRIRFDGRDVRHLAANELRSAFGVVPQETRLFSGTLYENLSRAAPGAGFEHIVAACRLAGIHQVIEALPLGYQTVVGEQGTGLSGGQKQRIAIARALLRQPRVLIFDEATSSLDATSAEDLARTVSSLRGRVTVIFITHHVPEALMVDQRIPIGGRSEPARCGT